jgi:small subunit ribosomal protein S7
MEIAAQKLKSEDPLVVLEKALKNVYPHMEVRSRRVGGANYQIPYEVRGTRQTHLGLMWFVESVRARRKTMGKNSSQAMAAEIVDASNETGATVKKRDDVHRMAEANRAFAHFARY